MKTGELKPYRSWVTWSGTVALVKRIEAHPLRSDCFLVEIDRFNMDGFKLGSPVLTVHVNAEWVATDRPKALS